MDSSHFVPAAAPWLSTMTVMMVPDMSHYELHTILNHMTGYDSNGCLTA